MPGCDWAFDCLRLLQASKAALESELATSQAAAGSLQEAARQAQAGREAALQRQKDLAAEMGALDGCRAQLHQELARLEGTIAGLEVGAGGAAGAAGSQGGGHDMAARRPWPPQAPPPGNPAPPAGRCPSYGGQAAGWLACRDAAAAAAALWLGLPPRRLPQAAMPAPNSQEASQAKQGKFGEEVAALSAERSALQQELAGVKTALCAKTQELLEAAATISTSSEQVRRMGRDAAALPALSPTIATATGAAAGAGQLQAGALPSPSA
jgi:hypothetical protein